MPSWEWVCSPIPLWETSKGHCDDDNPAYSVMRPRKDSKWDSKSDRHRILTTGLVSLNMLVPEFLSFRERTRKISTLLKVKIILRERNLKIKVMTIMVKITRLCVQPKVSHKHPLPAKAKGTSCKYVGRLLKDRGWGRPEKNIVIWTCENGSLHRLPTATCPTPPQDQASQHFRVVCGSGFLWSTFISWWATDSWWFLMGDTVFF